MAEFARILPAGLIRFGGASASRNSLAPRADPAVHGQRIHQRQTELLTKPLASDGASFLDLHGSFCIKKISNALELLRKRIFA